MADSNDRELPAVLKIKDKETAKSGKEVWKN